MAALSRLAVEYFAHERHGTRPRSFETRKKFLSPSGMYMQGVSKRAVKVNNGYRCVVQCKAEKELFGSIPLKFSW